MQFFALIYFWAGSQPEGMGAFFKVRQNQIVVQVCMTRLLNVMTYFDTDRSSRLSKLELDNLFRANLPSHFDNYQRIYPQFNPQVAL